MKIENLKVKFGKFSTEFEKFFRKRGEIWNRGECIIASGGWTPLVRAYMHTVYAIYKDLFSLLFHIGLNCITLH